MQVFLNPQINLKEEDYSKLNTGNLSLKVKVGSIIYQDDKEKSEAEIKNSSSAIRKELEVLMSFPADGLTKLIIQNEVEQVKPEKPFDPYTAYPAKGKSFYIGSPETFNKPLELLSVRIKKTKDVKLDSSSLKKLSAMVSQNDSGEYDVSLLNNRSWIELTDSNGGDFSQG